MIYDDRFADYISVRKATPEEIEFGAYPNATVETVIKSYVSNSMVYGR